MAFQKGHKLGVGKKYWLGKHHTEETKLKIGGAQLGEKNHNWKEGKRKSRGDMLCY